MNNLPFYVPEITHFYVGQVGLLLGAGSGIVLIDRLSKLPTPPSWEIPTAIWFKSAFASILLGQEHLLGVNLQGVPTGVYYFFLMFGLERCVFLVSIVYPRRKLLSIQATNIMTLVGGLLLLFGVGWSIYSGITANTLLNRKEIKELAVKVEQVNQVALSDTTRRSSIITKVDSVLTLSASYKKQIDILSKGLAEKDKRIDQLTKTVIILSRTITSLSATLERFRSSFIQVPAIPPTQSDPAKNSLRTDRVYKP